MLIKHVIISLNHFLSLLSPIFYRCMNNILLLVTLSWTQAKLPFNLPSYLLWQLHYAIIFQLKVRVGRNLNIKYHYTLMICVCIYPSC